MSAQVSAAMKARCRHPAYFKKIARAEDLIHHFPNNAYVGWSGEQSELLRVVLNLIELELTLSRIHRCWIPKVSALCQRFSSIQSSLPIALFGPSLLRQRPRIATHPPESVLWSRLTRGDHLASRGGTEVWKELGLAVSVGGPSYCRAFLETSMHCWIRPLEAAHETLSG